MDEITRITSIEFLSIYFFVCVCVFVCVTVSVNGLSYGML